MEDEGGARLEVVGRHWLAPWNSKPDLGLSQGQLADVAVENMQYGGGVVAGRYPIGGKHLREGWPDCRHLHRLPGHLLSCWTRGGKVRWGRLVSLLVISESVVTSAGLLVCSDLL